jgi:mevalonate kinase
LNKQFYSNGKLLLTGEYVVLDGAVALAIPTKYGQSLSITASETNTLQWKSLDEKDAIWFQTTFTFDEIASEEIHTAHLEDASSKRATLLNILQQAKQLNPDFLSENKGYTISTSLNFPRDWGLGTSSTLINNIAQWAEVNAFELLERSFGGSGYDIAAAGEDGPFLYKRATPPVVKSVHLPWDFSTSLFFVHLNRKQDSKAGINHYRHASVKSSTIQRISDISQKLLLCYTLSDFEQLIVAHERLVSEAIQLPTIKERFFSDYPNAIKSLGAWGGDFILAIGDMDAMDYFRKKGFTTIIPFSEMIK